MTEFWEFISQTILGELLIVILGVLVARPIQEWLDSRRFGNWSLLITRGTGKMLKEELDDSISAGKMKEILNVPEDMAVFLRGRIRPFEMLNCDLMSEGPELGLLKIDRKARKIHINLDKNPQKDA